MAIDDLENENISIAELKKIAVEVIKEHSSELYDFGATSEEDDQEY